MLKFYEHYWLLPEHLPLDAFPDPVKPSMKLDYM
jgi:hypothetical protein